MKAGGVPISHRVMQAAAAAPQYDNDELRPEYVGLDNVCVCWRLVQFGRRWSGAIYTVHPQQQTPGHYIINYSAVAPHTQ